MAITATWRENTGHAMDLKTYIGQKIKLARQRRQLTQEQLASRLGKAVETISNIERGHALTGLETLYAISSELNTPLNFFLPDAISSEKAGERQKTEIEAASLIETLPDADLETVLLMLRGIATARMVQTPKI